MTSQDFLENLSPTLFWDVDPASVDAVAHKQFVICRVMDRGSLQDVRRTQAYYSSAEIKEALLNARSLHKKTIAYFAVMFDLPREAFRAYTFRKTTNWDA
jgi:hypothetical protein